MISWRRWPSRPVLRMPTKPEIELAISVHNRLSSLLSPVNVSTIKASNIRTNYSLLIICLIATIAFLLFMLAAFFAAAPGAGTEAGAGKFVALLELIGAAGIGSAFSQLYTASEYLVNGTFDPKYNQIYLIRFALGFIAGVILGQFGPDLFSINGGNFAKVAHTTLALIGGFSAEVVYQLLQRFADTMVTAVRGTGKERAEAAADKETSRKLSDAASQIYNAVDPSLPAEAQRRLREIARNVRSSTKKLGQSSFT